MTSGSNTGLKGISAKNYDGQIIGFNVSSQWRNQRLYEWVPVTGTVTAAFDQARRTRREFYRQQGKPRTENFIIGTTEGVTYHSRATVDGGPTWIAYIEVDGEKRATSFSVGDHGKHGARLKALAWRRQREIELHGAPFKP